MAARRPRFLRTLLLRSTHQKIALLFFLWTIIEAHISYYAIARAEREARSKAVLTKTPRVFIASLHWNNEHILRSEWNKGVVDLVKTLGPENVFVSVYESGSWDNSKGALRELDHELEKTGVGKKIVLDEETHKDLIAGQPGEEGWITVPDGSRMPRRIPYLSRLRNLSLQPLLELAENGTNFDHVLFLGDVVFSVRVPPNPRGSTANTSKIPDIITLLNTNHGHYAAACSLDFSKPPLFYDTFALRDAGGHEHATLTWPYFRASKSRKAMMHANPVRVSSCWNGIGSFSPHSSNSLLATSANAAYPSRHARQHLHRHPRPQVPGPPGLARGLAPRGLRVLPHPRRQPGLAHARRLCQSGRARRLLPGRVRRRAPPHAGQLAVADRHLLWAVAEPDRAVGHDAVV